MIGLRHRIGPLYQKDKHFSRREKVYGQFLTPSEVAEFIVHFVLVTAERTLGIDPSCGDGVFLGALVKAKFEKAVGIDIDPEMLYRLRWAMGGQAVILAGDGLQPLPIMEGSASAVVGNPPFSAKYGRVADAATLSNFELGKGRTSQPIEILFLERFLQLASPQGSIGIILPQGIFSALPLKTIRAFVMGKTSILGIISLPRGIFSNGTTSKTSILFAKKGKPKGKTFMGIATPLNHLPRLLDAYTQKRELEYPPAFWVQLDTESFEPEFYWSARSVQSFLAQAQPVAHLGDLLQELRCGRTEYGEKRKFAPEGIPFISAKTVTPLGIDFHRDRRFITPHNLMDKEKAHVLPDDVLFIRVGVGCSGRAAVVVDNLDTGVADDWMSVLRACRVSPSKGI